jgi:hypothetical protein
MRSSLVISLVSLAALAACSGGGGSNVGSDDNHPEVCQEQHELAKLGKRPSGEISISCPAHGIGFAYE